MRRCRRLEWMRVFEQTPKMPLRYERKRPIRKQQGKTKKRERNIDLHWCYVQVLLWADIVRMIFGRARRLGTVQNSWRSALTFPSDRVASKI
jgi:hypothetical protein